MHTSKKLMAISLLSASLSVTAAVAQDSDTIYVSPLTDPDTPMVMQKDQIEEYEKLTSPFTHAMQLHGRDGIAYITQDGRFIMRGVIFDTWTGEEIQTMEELRASRKSMDISHLGIEDKDVDPMYYGSGPAEVVLFVDPLCPYCGQLFDQIISDPTYARDYTFKIFVVPYLGEASSQATTRVSCAPDREEALQALLTKDKAWLMSQGSGEECDPQPIIQRTLLAQVLGITGVPYIIGANGGVSRGMPADLKTFLATN
jgi:thiol:disulfide interchange protein DsbC